MLVHSVLRNRWVGYEYPTTQVSTQPQTFFRARGFFLCSWILKSTKEVSQNLVMAQNLVTALTMGIIPFS